MNSPSRNIITINDILNSLFYWKDIFSFDYKKQLIIRDTLDKAISDLLPLNDLLIEPELFDRNDSDNDQ